MNNKVSKSEHTHTNHLINETSPYLLQHAHNPVDWYPWGEEALTKAKKENKLLIVSVGYAACHWCHVMEHESFEDSLVAEVMNEHFISIKVDREERPDIDDVYMTACNLITGRGGWPLNAIALPDGRPIWAGTYFPKKEWVSLLNQFVKLKNEDYTKLETSAERLTQGIKTSDQIIPVTHEQTFTKNQLDTFAKNIINVTDFKEGGRMGTQKFPMPSIYEFLLKEYDINKDPKIKEALFLTLDKMAEGGIYDHVGGGFSRYSVDSEWLVPHFEKMLYDNAQLISLYSKAYQLTGKESYKRVVNQTLEFITEELTDDSGLFYSSLDADSEGEEGKYYVWSSDEIEEILGQDYELFAYTYDISKSGNWEKNNIINRIHTNDEASQKFDLSTEEVHAKLINALDQLKTKRSDRVKPRLDDKVITAWNALMITALIDAYKATENQVYLQKATNALQFIEQYIINADGQLFRNYKNGKTSINAFLDDYALLIHSFIDAYEVTFNEEYLKIADKLAAYSIKHFQDDETGMFFYTSDIDPPLVARKKELGDNVIPGSNSAIARALYELGTLLYKREYTDISKQMLNTMSPILTSENRTDFYSNWAMLYHDHVFPIYEVAIVGEQAHEYRDELMTHFLPNALLLGGKTEGSLELLSGKLSEGETLIYVCQNRVCKFPVREVERAIEVMKK